MRIPLGLLVAPVFVFGLAGCGDDSGSSADMSLAPDMVACSGGPVAGAQDKHCYDDGGAEFITVDPSQCTVDAGDDSGGGDDFGDTMYNSSGNDDDCKYAVSFTIPGGICDMSNASFLVTLKDATTGQGIAGANNVRPEVFKNDAANTPVNTSASTTTDMGGGVYKIGPVKFPSSGSYTIRFHFYEACTDTPTSPHGHAAFFLNVP